MSMTVQGYDSVAMAPCPVMLPPMSRPQVGIERLPARRPSNEPRESMNCKSCRKRKIKCNRLRPACEACQVFQSACIYGRFETHCPRVPGHASPSRARPVPSWRLAEHTFQDAVPKKRGPKTDVLEALLKRVDGLEAKLKEKKTTEATRDERGNWSEEKEAGKVPDTNCPFVDEVEGEVVEDGQVSADAKGQDSGEPMVYSPVSPSTATSPAIVVPETLLDTYFSRFHAKPFHILDESTLRQRLQLNQAPAYLIHAICAVAARYTPHPNGYQSAVRLSEDFASRARSEMEMDEPCIDGLQALLLLVTAFTAAGRGKKAYMLQSDSHTPPMAVEKTNEKAANAVGMALALKLHREPDTSSRITPVEREVRRRLFWTCYLFDRWSCCGSRRPSLIGDETILLRLPSWTPNPRSLPVEGAFFRSDSNLRAVQGDVNKCQGSSGMLVDISRILGITNRYLASGGVKADSHFPWHVLSNLSQIRQELDLWASGAEHVFSSLDSLFAQPDSTVLVLSKVIYHLVHCLIYRPFLPIDLVELAGSGQQQSWQVGATQICFLHANAMAELVEVGKTAAIQWPAFVGYCISTAGTVHIHGAAYGKDGYGGEMKVCSPSADFLSREMQQLSELRYAWACVQQQRETLQGVYEAHAVLVKSLTGNPMRYSPGFHLDDFFDRYANITGPGGQMFDLDAESLSLTDVVVDFTADTYTGHDLYAPRPHGERERAKLKRKSTACTGGEWPDQKRTAPLQTAHAPNPMAAPIHAEASYPPAALASQSPMHTHTHTLPSRIPPYERGTETATLSLDAQSVCTLGSSPLSPHYSFAQLHASTQAGMGGQYDPMFGLPTNTFSSPAPWQGEDQPRPTGASSSGAASRSGSISTTVGEEQDGFLSMLEQWAEKGDLKYLVPGSTSAGGT